MRNAVSAVVVAVILAGCTTYSLIEPRRTAIGDFYTVEPQIPWSAAREGRAELWTVDGPLLESLRFMKGLRDGDPLFEGRDQDKRPRFQKTMTASDIMEFVADSVSMQGGQKLTTHNLRPVQFGNAPGFRFELSFVSQEGLEKEALVVGAVIKDQLHLIMYAGARAHYYPKYKEHVERLIESIKMQ